MIVSAARLHGRASSRRRVYPRGGGNDNRALLPRPALGGERVHARLLAFRLHDPRRDLAAQPLPAEQRVGAGFRDLDALGGKVLAEEIEMRCTLVELLRRQY